jgi:hypothetical protein
MKKSMTIAAIRARLGFTKLSPEKAASAHFGAGAPGRVAIKRRNAAMGGPGADARIPLGIV